MGRCDEPEGRRPAIARLREAIALRGEVTLEAKGADVIWLLCKSEQAWSWELRGERGYKVAGNMAYGCWEKGIDFPDDEPNMLYNLNFPPNQTYQELKAKTNTAL